MPRSRPPYPPELCQQMIELVRAGRTPEELAEEFEPSAQAIRNWVAQADRDEGRGNDGLTSAEREELIRLRREVKQLRVGGARDPLRSRGSSLGSYGAPRIHAELAAEGVHVGRKRVAR